MTVYTSARQVWHDTYTLAEMTPGDGRLTDPKHARFNWFTQKAAKVPRINATQPKKGSRVANIPEQIELVKGHKIIKSLPPLFRSWGMYAYTHQATMSDQGRVRDYVYKIWFQSQHKSFGGNFEKTRRHLTLVVMAIDDMKHRYATKKPRYIDTEYAMALQIDRQNFKRDWAGRLSALQSIIDEIDKKALAPLAKMLADREALNEEFTYN